ncbi:hypothetical protein YC2023_124027 [Brassica napus]
MELNQRRFVSISNGDLSSKTPLDSALACQHVLVTDVTHPSFLAMQESNINKFQKRIKRK